VSTADGVAVQLDPARQAVLAGVADQLIPAAHGMPSAGDVVDARSVAFVLGARPDLADPLRAALGEDLPSAAGERLAVLEASRPDLLAAVHLVVVGGYYANDDVRAALGYPGQVARPVSAFDYPEYVEEGLIDRVLARGQVWRASSMPVAGDV
jgi:hypothetical protein